MLYQLYNLNCCLVLGYVVILGPYSFQDIVLLNPCFKCSKNVISSMIDKVTAGT